MLNEKPISIQRDLAVSAIWGFAEAIFFFIVPDVWITRIALRNLCRAIMACFIATIAAVLGGAIMFIWGHEDAAAVERELLILPAISPEMIVNVQHELKIHGGIGIMQGPILGVPYKIYAAEAGRLSLPFVEFLSWSTISRLSRFLLLTLVAGMAARCLNAWTWMLPWMHAGLWTLFYSVYFLMKA